MYVMERFQLVWDDALQMVQNKRYCISPNNGFITQIKVRSHTYPNRITYGHTYGQEYESIYKAQQAIQSASPTASVPRSAQARRKREEDDEDEEE